MITITTFSQKGTHRDKDAKHVNCSSNQLILYKLMGNWNQPYKMQH